MNLKTVPLKSCAALCLPLLSLSMVSAQVTGPAEAMPKVGSPAPALAFNHLLGAPAGARADWPSLRGKVVVLEFWATWCAPCIAEIPLLNSLQASLDPSKVQFISVDDEDPAVVAAFLKKKPISGWVGIDTTGKVFERYGLNSRPDTVVIGPDGRVVSTTLRPEQLKRDELLKLVKGKPVQLTSTVDPKIQADLDAGVMKAFADQIGSAAGSADVLFDLRVTAATPVPEGQEAQTHIMMMGPGKMDITQSPIDTLLENGAGIPQTRLTVIGVLPKAVYNLDVNAPHADKKQLNHAIGVAIASAAGLTIEYKTADAEALVLTALPDSKAHVSPDEHSGFAFYDPKTHTVKCISANAGQVASALETAIGRPVVDESGLKGRISADVEIASKELGAANEVLAKALGLTLNVATRPIETVVVTVVPPPPEAKTEGAPQP